MDRRNVLSMSTLALLWPARSRVASAAAGRIGLHLASVRRAVEADLGSALGMIAGLGYQEIEFWIPDGLAFDAVATRQRLDSVGLAAPSRHVRMADLLSNWRRLLRECQILGNRHVVCGEIPEQERATFDGYRRVVDLLNPAGRITQSAGLQLAIRYRADDFRPRGGIVPYEYVLSHTDPALVKIQIDLSEMVRAGGDPVADLARHSGRFASIHINDVAVGREQAAVGLGEGRIDLPRILARASKAGVMYYFVDDQRPETPWEHAKANLAYLSLEF
jgi:sugar phosphate isomerase/epimerase